MNKLHKALLASAVCSMVQGLTASQEQQKPFFSDETKSKCRVMVHRVGPFYSAAALMGVFRNGYRCFVNPQLNLIQRSFFENKRDLSPSKFVNFHKANLKLFGGLGITFPFVCAALLAWDNYQQNLNKTQEE